MSENNNPYDTLFRAAFAEPQAAKDLTLFLLPQSRERGFAAAQVTVEPESLVDEQARTHRTDLLLQFSRPRRGGATRAASAYVYVLYEHKSYSYRWVTVQLLRYMATIWQRLTGETDKHGDGLLPDILPVVIYHGGEPWAAPLQFAELVEGGREAAHVPHYEPVFVDLTGIKDHRITGPLRLTLGLIALKYARKKMTQADGDLLTELLHRGSEDPATRHLVQVVEQVYVTVKPESEVKDLVAAATRLGYHEVEGGYMTYAEAKRKEGLEEGLRHGAEQGALQRSRDVLIRLVDRKFGLVEAERERIMVCEDQAALDAALDEILDASSKAQVLKKLS